MSLLTFYVFVLMIIPSPLEFAPLGGAGSPATVFAAVLFGCYLLTWLHPALAPERAPQPVRFAAICFGCSIVATYVSANLHEMPTLELNGADRGIILTCGWLGVLLLACDGIDRLYRLETLVRRIVLGATVMAAIAATQFFTGLNFAKYVVIPGLVSTQPFYDIGTRDALYRVSATAIDAIELAAVLAVCLPLAVHLARFAAPSRSLRRWSQSALIAAAIPMTLSRTGILALTAAAIVMLPTWPRRDRRIAYAIGALGSLAMWAVVPGLATAFRSLFSEVGSDTSSQSRTGAITSAEPFIHQHPWLGRGFGTFLPQTYFFTDDQYLHTLIETGAFGLLALVGLLATGWFTARSIRRVTADPQIRDLAQSLAAAIASAAVSFATLDAFSFMIISGMTFMLLGCVGALWRLTDASPAVDPNVTSVLPARCDRPGKTVHGRHPS